MTARQGPREKVYVHKLFVRVFHWVNALGLTLMIMSGWRIYNASPLFDFRFPNGITLRGWLAGALQWHFAAMWLLVINLLIYVIVGFASGHFTRRFTPVSPSSVVGDMKRVEGKTAPSATTYNAVQKAAYIGVLLAIILTIISGASCGSRCNCRKSDFSWAAMRAPACAFLRHGGNLRLYCAAPDPRIACAQHADTDDHRLGPQTKLEQEASHEH